MPQFASETPFPQFFEDAFRERLQSISLVLYEARAKRKQPGTDDKVLSAWNGLMIAGLADSGRVLGDAALIEAGLGIAIKAIDGDHRAAAVALLEVLQQFGLAPAPASRLPEFARPVIVNTNGEVVGSYEPRGSITFTSSKSR